MDPVCADRASQTFRCVIQTWVIRTAGTTVLVDTGVHHDHAGWDTRRDGTASSDGHDVRVLTFLDAAHLVPTRLPGHLPGHGGASVRAQREGIVVQRWLDLPEI